MADGSSLNCLDAEVFTDLVNHKSDVYSLDAKNQNIKCEGVQNANGNGNDNDDEIFCTGVKDDLTTSNVETSEKEFNSCKSKRESLSGMVNWMRTIAKHPFDPLAQPLLEQSKWKEYKGGQDFFVQMLRSRDVLSVRKHAEPNGGSSSKKSLSGMVNWMRTIAKHPFDPLAQPLPEPSKWKEYKGGQDFFVQMQRARDVLSIRKHAEPNGGSSSKKSLSGMVNWMRTIAKHPFDPLAQPLPEPSKWKEYKGGQDFFVQMLRARDVLSVRKHAEANGGSSSKKSLSGMVNWMRTIAQHPFDPLGQPLPEPSKWKEYKGGQDFFVQMLRARDVLSVRKHAEPNGGSSSKKVKMHPAMYEDPVSLGHQGTVNLRRSERIYRR